MHGPTEERPHQVISRPDKGATAWSREGRIRRRFDRRLQLLRIPDDLSGWSVLDIGAWHGFFSFECERRGADRVLAVDHAVAERWGEITAHPTVPAVDGLLAATALVHDLVVVTLNVRHIAPTGARCLDPFEACALSRIP